MKPRFSLIPAAAILLPIGANAAVLAYDGFDGYNNAVDNYDLPPNGNAILYDEAPAGGGTTGQNPAKTGFTGAWNSASDFADSIYVKGSANQIIYNDGSNNVLNTTTGQMQISRDTGSTGSGIRTWSRNLDIGTSLPQTLYVSMVIQATSGVPFSWRSASTKNGGEARRFGYDVSATGELSVIGVQASGGSLAQPVGNIAFDQPQMLVMRFDDNVNPDSGSGAEGDQMKFWLNPILTSEASNPSPTILSTTDNKMNWYVRNSAWTLGYTEFNVDAEADESVIFDEFRIGNTWEEVTPFTVVPEPSGLLLLSIGTLGALFRKKR